MSQSDPVARLFLDRNCPANHVELPEELIRWLAREGYQAENVLRFERLKRENRREYRRLILATDDGVSRSIVATMVRNSGTASYVDLDRAVDASRKTVRRRLTPLTDDDVIDVSATQPPIASFTTEAVAVLAEDALASYYNTNETNKSQQEQRKQRNGATEQVAGWTDSVQLAADGSADPFAHVEVGDPGHPVEFSRGGEP